MFRQRLTQPVEVVGRNYFGLASRMLICPTNRPGWYWNVLGKEIPITPNMIEGRKRRVAIKDPDSNTSINVFEHIGVLRALGLDGVVFSSDPWPPYDGCAQTLWDALSPYTTMGRQTIPWSTVPYEFVGMCSNRKRYTRIQPNNQKRLYVTVVVDYPSLGRHELQFEVSDTQEEVVDKGFISVGSQGWPRGLYPLSKTASLLHWPHHKNIVWPQHYRPDETIRKFAEHRMLDVLGDISLLFPQGGMLSANILSHCSGHEADVEVVKHFARNKLIPL